MKARITGEKIAVHREAKAMKLWPVIVPHLDKRHWRWKASLRLSWKYVNLEFGYNFGQWFEASLWHSTMDRGPIICAAFYLLGLGVEFQIGNDRCLCCEP